LITELLTYFHTSVFVLCITIIQMKNITTMRKILLLIGLLAGFAATQVLFAQNITGAIQFEDRVNMHKRLPPDRQEMKAMIPEYRTTKFQLIFNLEESLYKPIIEDEEDQEFSNGGGGMRMRFRTPNVETYLNYNTGKLVQKQEFMGKEYLIEDSVKVSPWKFGTETKMILGYECRQAYYTDEVQLNVNGEARKEKREVTAWFTDKIRPFLGPEKYNSLPGAVLALDINNGERVMVAVKIDLRELKKNELKAPEKGEKVTQEAYRKMVEEQMKRMSGNGVITIRN
jgi:GLPGLI family protein